MAIRTSGAVTTEDLRSLGLADLLVAADDGEEERVQAFLELAIEAAAEYVAEHGKELESLPQVRYDRWESGIRYDPYHADGEMIIVGGPRGLLQGGNQLLKSRGHIDQVSLLALLSKGLLTSYNQELVEAREERPRGDPASSPVDIYGRFDMLKPAVDEGFTLPFVLHTEADITDAELRTAFVERWTDWFTEMETFDSEDVPLFRATARTVCDRVDEVEGTPRERMVHALGIQERLVRDGDVSVIADRLDLLV